MPRLYHPKKGIITKVKDTFDPIKGVKNNYVDSNGKPHNLDGTEMLKKHLNAKESAKFDEKIAEIIKRKEEQKRLAEEVKLAEEEVQKEEEDMKKEEKEHAEVLTTIEMSSQGIVDAIESIPETKEVRISNQIDTRDELSAIKQQMMKLVMSIDAQDNTDIISAIEKIKLEIPKAEKQQFIDYTNQLKEIADKLNFTIDFTPIITAILSVPQFEIPQELIHEGRIKVEVDRIALGGGGGIGQASVDNLASIAGTNLIYLIDPVGTTTYIGQAQGGSTTSSSNWSIMKIDTSTSVTAITLANGNSNFSNTWDNRAILTYN